MSEPEVNAEGRGGTVYDDPNREAVGLDPAWVEGTGGGEAPVPVAEAEAEVSVEDNTKDELLAYAHQIGASPANAGMTKDELQASIDAKLAEGEAPG